MHANGKSDGAGGAQRTLDHGEARKGDAGENDFKLDESAQQLIGQHLKAVYDEIVQQPVPDQFLRLLDELERKERGQ
jgi:hypothetical protein